MVKMLPSHWAKLAAFLLALGVGAGALGAHALKNILDTYSLEVFHKGVFYHLFHALGLFVIVILQKQGLLTLKDFNRVALLIFCGILFFCGSLYLRALTGVPVSAVLAPVGGICFIVGWVVLGMKIRPSA